MTPQEVIKAFMAKLDNHGFSYSEDVGTKMLDAAIKASSKFDGITDVITKMTADQVKAETEAIVEIFGEDYKNKTLSDLNDGEKNQLAKDNTKAKSISNAFYNNVSSDNANSMTVENVINERKAYIFLEKYCGIQLATRYWCKVDGGYTYYGSNNGSTDNIDTGAITGSDANITLAGGTKIDSNGKILDSDVDVTDDVHVISADDASIEGARWDSANNCLIIGTGTEKTDRSVVPEIGNKYTATTTTGQTINTGSNDWIVKATDANDVITSGGADSIDAADGADSIIVNADHATIITGAGNDTVNIDSKVNIATITDLTSSDCLNINGTFEIQSARIESDILIITDKTGSRTIRIGNIDEAANAIIGESKTLTDWLSKAGFDLNNLKLQANYGVNDDSEAENDEVESGRVVISEDSAFNEVEEYDGRTQIDPGYTPTPLSEPVDITIPKSSIKKSSIGGGKRLLSSGSTVINLDKVDGLGGVITDSYTYDGTAAAGSGLGNISNEYPDITTYTKNGLTVKLLGHSTDKDSGNVIADTNTLSALTDSEKMIFAGLYKWWIKECLKLNKEAYGLDFTTPGVTANEINTYFYSESGSGTLAAVLRDSTTGVSSNLRLNVNMGYYDGVTGENVDGEGTGTNALLDRTIAHEINHAILGANINYFSQLPGFIKEGLAELVHGIDDERGNVMFKIAYDATQLAASIDTSNTGTGGQDVGDKYAGGYMFLRYFARQASLQTLFTPAPGEIVATVNLTGDGDYKVSGYEKTEIAVTNGEGSVALGSASNKVYTVNNEVEAQQIVNINSAGWTVNNVKTNVTVNGSAGSDTINGSGGSYMINGNGGNDLINAAAGANLTLIGGEGNNTIDGNSTAHVYSQIKTGSGNDSITFFGQGSTIDAGDGSNIINADTNAAYVDFESLKSEFV